MSCELSDSCPVKCKVYFCKAKSISLGCCYSMGMSFELLSAVTFELSAFNFELPMVLVGMNVRDDMAQTVYSELACIELAYKELDALRVP
jgi:hypothetical protein